MVRAVIIAAVCAAAAGLALIVGVAVWAVGSGRASVPGPVFMDDSYTAIRRQICASRFWDAPPAPSRIDAIVDELAACKRETLGFVDSAGLSAQADYAGGLIQVYERQRVVLHVPPSIGPRYATVPLWRFRTRPDRVAVAQALLEAIQAREWREPAK